MADQRAKGSFEEERRRAEKRKTRVKIGPEGDSGLCRCVQIINKQHRFSGSFSFSALQLFHFLAGRRVVEDTSGLSNYDPSQDETVKQIMALKIGDGSGSGGPFQDALRKTITDGDGVVNPNIKGPRPVVSTWTRYSSLEICLLFCLLL